MIIFRLLKRINSVLPMLLLGIVFVVVGMFAMSYSTMVTKNIVDNIIVPVTQGNTLDIIALRNSCLFFFGLIAMSNVIGFVGNYTMMKCANRITERLRNECFDKMQALPISYFDNKPAGKIATRIVNNTETLRSRFYGNILTRIFNNIINIIITYGMIFYLDYRLGLLLLLLFPIFVVWQKIYIAKTKEPLKEYYEAQSDINSKVNEVINGRVIMQLFKREKLEMESFEKASDIMFESDRKILIANSTISWSLVALFSRLFQMMILAIIGYSILGGMLGISVGLIFSIINYTDRLFESFGMLVRLLPDVGRTLETGKRVYEILDEEIEIDSEEELVLESGDVEFKNVDFSYKKGVPVLKNVSFFANKGETIALVGHTSSGKSSIINLLFRFYDADSGEVLIDGKNIQNYSRESVRKDMGIVLQDPYLFTGTIASNISMGNQKITDEIVMDSLTKVGADYMIKKLENGIHEKVTEKGSAFSSGERQLISFARTLASNPKILILDEATSHIDTETEEIIQNAMEVVKEGRTTFIIAHRLSTIQNADKILVLENGQIVESGKHAELLEKDGIYVNMYRLQQKI